MCVWALVPFWRAIIKMGNVLGWGGTLGEGGGIYRSSWDKRISSLFISSSEFVWRFKQNPKSFLCPATPHWSTPAWLWTVPAPPPHFSFLSWTSLKSHWFSFCFFTLPNSWFFAPAVLSTWLFSHVFQWFLVELLFRQSSSVYHPKYHSLFLPLLSFLYPLAISEVVFFLCLLIFLQLKCKLSWGKGPPCSLIKQCQAQNKMENAVWMSVCVLSCVGLFATPWTVAHQVPLSKEFFKQENWSGLPILKEEMLKSLHYVDDDLP